MAFRERSLRGPHLIDIQQSGAAECNMAIRTIFLRPRNATEGVPYSDWTKPIGASRRWVVAVEGAEVLFFKTHQADKAGEIFRAAVRVPRVMIHDPWMSCNEA